MQQMDLLTILNGARQIVAARLVIMLCLIMAFSLFCWAMWMGTPLALGTAGAFAVIVFLPVLAKSQPKGASSEEG
jgi:uncharacterized membrane protein